MPKKPGLGRIFQRSRKDKRTGKVVKSPRWTIEYRVDGKPATEPSHSTDYAVAEALLRRRIAEIDGETYGGVDARTVRIKRLLDLLLEHFKENKPKSLEWGRIVVTCHLDPFFGSTRAVALTSAKIEAYKRHRRRQGVKDSTINREFTILRRAFTLGTEQMPKLVVRVPRFPILPEPPPRKGFFEYDEFTGLRSELPEPLRPVITFGYNTGCRKGETLFIEWTQVDLAAKEVRLYEDDTKNSEPRILPLFGELLEMLLMLHEKRQTLYPTCRWVFTRDGRNRIKDFRGAWDEACKRAGLWNKDLGRPTRLFHDLRRTGARNLVRAGVPEAVVMRIGGWKTRSVFDRYNIVSTRDLHDAAAKLELYHEGLAAAAEQCSQSKTQSNPHGRVN
jgi:integrase